MSEITTRRGGGSDSPVIVRTDLSALLSEYTNSQRRCMYKIISNISVYMYSILLNR